MSISTNFTLYLSAEGDSIEIKNFKDGVTIPEQMKASACKTHEQVLAFLLKLKDSRARDSLSFYHQHNTCYHAHRGTWPIGMAHQCSLEKQIDFVSYKIAEKHHGIRTPMSLSERVFWFVLGWIAS